MEFKFETVYDQKAFTAMAKTLRKTVRKKKSQRSHIFGWIVVVAAVLLAFFAGDEGFTLDFRTIVTAVAVVVMIAALIWEDQINGYVAMKRTLPGTNRSICSFREFGYCSETDMGKTQWSYDKPVLLAETEEYFVFIFSSSHAQLYDKSSISGGTADEFRSFIERKTGKKVQLVK
ncbi:MAG: YcxB family protein [Lachnospiraceae bacterium]|nr:YcxB family protein [Lachnospiraceae bacterium]